MSPKKREHIGYFITLIFSQNDREKIFTLFISAKNKIDMKKGLVDKIKNHNYYNTLKKNGDVRVEVVSVTLAS